PSPRPRGFLPDPGIKTKNTVHTVCKCKAGRCFSMRTIRLSFPWRRVVALFFACLVCTALWAEAAQSQLADKVIRLHVLANSDSQADQALKLYVRDQILAQTTPLLEGVTSAPEAEAILQANLGLLTQTAQAAIAAQGYD